MSGVPQGTVLGPLLFLLYVNDITEGIGSEIRLFADDCVLYRTIRSERDANVLQDDLNHLCDWGDLWQMCFNVKKCNIMHMTRKHHPVLHNYSMKGSYLSVVKSHPYLGVTIQDDLKWDVHVDGIVKKASRTLGMLRRNIHGCSREVKSMAYKSLVRPSLEYASSCWDPHNAKHINTLEMVQRRAARFACKDYRQ
ncbi:MAG: reverse transcriptase domain-containing protein, partial [Oscillospiraceae bacterium]